MSNQEIVFNNHATIYLEIKFEAYSPDHRGINNK